MPLPPTRYIDAGPGVPLAKPGVAMAQGEAMARMGETISQIGDKGFEIAERARKFEEAGKTAEFFRQRNEEASKFSNELLTRSDTNNWGKDFEEKASSWNDGLQNLGLSPAGLERAKSELADWSSRQKIHFETQAAVKSVEMGQMHVNNAIEQSLDQGDREGAVRAMRIASAGGMINPAQEEKLNMHINEKMYAFDANQHVDQDPQSFLAESEKIDQYLKANLGASYDLVNQFRSRATAKLRENTINTINAAQDDAVRGMTIDQIETKYSAKLRPEEINSVQKFALEYQSDRARIARADPNNQALVAGELTRLIDGYVPDLSQPVDMNGVEISQTLLNLPEGPLRKAFEDKFKAKQAALDYEAKMPIDQALKSLDEVAKNGGLVKLPDATDPPILTQKMINDGFLKNPDKLKSLRFSDEQIALINEKTGANKKEEPSNAIREERFKRLWESRADKTASNDSLAQATAEAIVNMKPTVDWSTPEANKARTAGQIKYDQTLGMAKVKLMDWYKSNLEASSQQIEEKVREIAGEQARKAFHESNVPPKPTRKIDPSTSQVPTGTRTTAYGYPGDPTPDRLSKKGIASFTTHEDAMGSRDAPTRLRAGDIAVSPDVEERLRAAGVKPREMITVKLSDGSSHQGRWMDRTADYLKGRLDIYSPSGVPKNDGTEVVGWSI